MTKHEKIEHLAKHIGKIIRKDPAMCLGFMAGLGDQVTAENDLTMAIRSTYEITKLLEDDENGD